MGGEYTLEHAPYLAMIFFLAFSWGLIIGTRVRLKRERKAREMDS